MKELNIINNPQFDLRYFTRGDKYNVQIYSDAFKSYVSKQAILVSNSPFVLTFKLINPSDRNTYIDIPVDQYVNGHVKIKKEVI